MLASNGAYEAAEFYCREDSLVIPGAAYEAIFQELTEQIGGDLSKYTLADYDLANILYGSYQVDAVLAYAHAAHSLFEEGKTICQNLNDNPCVTSANGLSVEYNESCVATTPCTTALKDRLFSLTSQNVAGLTGSLHFENVTKDRIVT